MQLERWDVTIETVELLEPDELQRLRRELGPQAFVRRCNDGIEARMAVEAIGVEVAGTQALGSYRQARGRASLAKRTVTRIDVSRQRGRASDTELMGIAE